MKILKGFFTKEKKKMESPGVHNNGKTLVAEPKTVYQCPMKCEGSKTYNEPGDCPVCNMHLVAVNEINSSKHQHNCC